MYFFFTKKKSGRESEIENMRIWVNPRSFSIYLFLFMRSYRLYEMICIANVLTFSLFTYLSIFQTFIGKFIIYRTFQRLIFDAIFHQTFHIPIRNKSCIRNRHSSRIQSYISPHPICGLPTSTCAWKLWFSFFQRPSCSNEGVSQVS